MEKRGEENGDEELCAQRGPALPCSRVSNPSPKSFRRKQKQQNKLQSGAAAAIKKNPTKTVYRAGKKKKQATTLCNKYAQRAYTTASNICPELASSCATL